MKTKNYLSGTFILGIGLALTGCASIENFHDERLDKSEQLDSIGHSAPVLESSEAKIAMLEDIIMNLHERIAVFYREQYFDPYEFRLSGWEILKKD